jgi:4-amino-4-deoxy-L-arabinose transferase-like glycosyltransferase
MCPPGAPYTTARDTARRRIGPELGVLVIAALAVYAANPFGILLRAVDDCFWARRGVEIARTAGLFNLRWEGGVDWEYAPLQCWLLGRSFAIFGENDLAARLPSIVFAIGSLLIVYRIGTRRLGAGAAGCAVALLAISPYFLDNARGCMMEMALTFWVSLAFLVFLEGLERPALHALFAIPLAAALMTKSIMGLLPLGVLAVAALVSPALRRPWTSPWFATGVVLGVLLGASWFVAQAFLVGAWTLKAHLLAYVGTRAMKPLGLMQHLFGYPIFLLERFQPLILPAVAGVVMMARRARRERDPELLVLLAWIVVPLVALSIPGTQARRWLFPLFPPLALCAGWAIESLAPRASWWIRRVVAPVALAATAVWFWVSPPPFLFPSDRAIVDHRALLQARIPIAEPLTYLGPELSYWPLANPLLYYDERVLEPPAPNADQALMRARSRRSQLLLCDVRLLSELTPGAAGATRVVQGRDWVVLDLTHVTAREPAAMAPGVAVGR